MSLKIGQNTDNYPMRLPVVVPTRSILPVLAIFTLLSTLVFPGELSAQRNQKQIIYAFRNYTRPSPTKMILVGEIRSKIKVAKAQDVKSPYLGYDTRLDQVTVNVVNRTGLKAGQKLYVIDKNPYHKKFRNGLIVGEIKVRAILYNSFYGWVLTGTGILLRVREGMFVARTLDSEKLEAAYETKKRGDYHYNRGDTERAITAYHDALEADQGLPEAHAALGRLYLDLARRQKDENPVRALGEFERAWRSRNNFRYKYDKFRFYLDYMETLFFSYQQRRLDTGGLNNRDEFMGILERIIMVGKEARLLKPRGAAVLLHLGRAEFLRMRLFAGLNRTGGEQERARKQAGMYFIELFKRTVIGEEAHRVAFLYYFDLYGEITHDPKVENTKLQFFAPMFRYSNDFKRWEDIRFGNTGQGADRLRRMLIYHARQYFRYLQPGKDYDRELMEKFQSLSPERY